MAKGNYAALQRITPIETDFGKIARDQEQIDARRRAEQRAIDRTKKRDADKLKADERRLSDRKVAALGNMKDVFTGIGSVDEGLAYGVNAATEELIKTVEALDKDPNNVKLQLKQANLLKYSDNLAQMVDREKTYAADLAAGVKSGKYSQTENAGILQSLSDKYKNANFIASIDENGRPIFEEQYDNENKITRGYNDMFDGSWLTKPVEAFNEQGFFANTDKLGTTDDTWTSADGITTQRVKNLSEGSETALGNMVDDILGTEETGATGQARDYWTNVMKRDPEKFDLNKARTNLAESAKGRHDVISSKKRNENLLIARERLAMAKTKAAADAKAKANSTAGGKKYAAAKANVNIMLDADKNLVKRTIETAGGAEELVGFNIPKTTVKMGDGDVEVKRFFLAPDGRVHFEGRKKVKVPATTDDDGEDVAATTKWVNVTGDPFNDLESNEFAARLGFTDAHQLKQAAEEQLSPSSTVDTTETTSKEIEGNTKTVKLSTNSSVL